MHVDRAHVALCPHLLPLERVAVTAYALHARSTAAESCLVHWIELASADGVTCWRVTGVAVELVSGRDLGTEIVRRHRAALRRRLPEIRRAGVQLEIAPPPWATGAGADRAQEGTQV